MAPVKISVMVPVTARQKATLKARRDADRRHRLKVSAPPDTDMAGQQADNLPPAKPFEKIVGKRSANDVIDVTGIRRGRTTSRTMNRPNQITTVSLLCSQSRTSRHPAPWWVVSRPPDA